jgi:hypothetical protein
MVLGKVLTDLKQWHDDDKNNCENLKYPGDPAAELGKPVSQRTSPGAGWEWRGPADVGAWFNPNTDESLRPHPADDGHETHWDYKGRNGWEFRKTKDGCDSKDPTVIK